MSRNLTDFLVLSLFEHRILRELVRRSPVVERRNGYKRVLASIPEPLQDDYCRRVHDILFGTGIVQLPLIVQQVDGIIYENVNTDHLGAVEVLSSGRPDSPTIPGDIASERARDPDQTLISAVTPPKDVLQTYSTEQTSRADSVNLHLRETFFRDDSE